MDDFEESKEELNKPLPVKRFSVSTKEAVQMGILFVMREGAIQIIQAIWYFFCFRYVLHVEVEFWSFVIVVFFGKWISDSVQTAIDDSVRKDTRKFVMTVSKDRIMYDNLKNPKDEGKNDDGSD